MYIFRESTQTVISSSDQVGYMNFMKLNLVEKEALDFVLSNVKSSRDYVADIFENKLDGGGCDQEEEDEDDDNEKKEDVRPAPNTNNGNPAMFLDFSLPCNVDLGEPLSPNVFARSIESMETRDTIPMPANRVNVARNQGGWLWLGGIQGLGTDIEMAVNGSMQQLEGNRFVFQYPI